MRKYLSLGIFTAVAALAQQPAFEVASIRSAEQITPAMIQAGKLHVGMKIDAGKVDIGYLSLRELIPMAYDVKPFQLTGPDWLSARAGSIGFQRTVSYLAFVIVFESAFIQPAVGGIALSPT